MAGDRNFLGKGFHFPPVVDATTGRFIMTSQEDDIREAVNLILMTGIGERPMEPDFGCDIEQFIFDLPDGQARRNMEESILTALTRWEPRIDNIEVSVQDGRVGEGAVYIQIGYTVRSNNNPVNLVFPYYLDTGFGTWRQTGE